VATKNQQHSIVDYLPEQISSTNFAKDLINLAIAAGLEIYKLHLTKNPYVLKYEWRGLGDVVCITLARNKVDFLTYLLEAAQVDPG